MADWYPAFFAEIKGAILATWPNVAAGSFFTSIEGFRQNVLLAVARAQSGASDVPTPPYAILNVGTFIASEMGGVDARQYQAKIEIMYLDAVQNEATQDTQTGIMSQLNLMAAALETPATPFATFEWDGSVGLIDSSLDTAFDDKNYHAQGGILTYDPGFVIYVE